MTDHAARAKAIKARRSKRDAIGFHVGDPVQVLPGVPRWGGKPGEVSAINGEDKEVQLKVIGHSSPLWFRPRELTHDDDPVLADEDEVLEADNDDEWEEE